MWQEICFPARFFIPLSFLFWRRPRLMRCCPAICLMWSTKSGIRIFYPAIILVCFWTLVSAVCWGFRSVSGNILWERYQPHMYSVAFAVISVWCLFFTRWFIFLFAKIINGFHSIFSSACWWHLSLPWFYTLFWSGRQHGVCCFLWRSDFLWRQRWKMRWSAGILCEIAIITGRYCSILGNIGNWFLQTFCISLGYTFTILCSGQRICGWRLQKVSYVTSHTIWHPVSPCLPTFPQRSSLLRVWRWTFTKNINCTRRQSSAEKAPILTMRRNGCSVSFPVNWWHWRGYSLSFLLWFIWSVLFCYQGRDFPVWHWKFIRHLRLDILFCFWCMRKLSSCIILTIWQGQSGQRSCFAWWHRLAVWLQHIYRWSGMAPGS